EGEHAERAGEVVERVQQPAARLASPPLAAFLPPAGGLLLTGFGLGFRLLVHFQQLLLDDLGRPGGLADRGGCRGRARRARSGGGEWFRDRAGRQRRGRGRAAHGGLRLLGGGNRELVLAAGAADLPAGVLLGGLQGLAAARTTERQHEDPPNQGRLEPGKHAGL